MTSRFNVLRLARTARVAVNAQRSTGLRTLSTVSSSIRSKDGFASAGMGISRGYISTTSSVMERCVLFPVRRHFSTATEVVPSLGDSISEGTVVSFSKQVGDWVDADETILVMETDKVTVDIGSKSSGVITAFNVKEGDTVSVGAPLCTVDTTAAKPAGSSTPKAPAPAASAPAAPTSAAAAISAPVAAAAPTPAAAKAASAPTSAPSTSVTSGREDRRVKMTRMRQTIAKRLKDSQNTMAMLTTFNEIDMSGAMAMRSQYKDEFEKKHGSKLGFMSVFMKASASALQAFPDVNAYIDMNSNEIVYRNYVDISVAVATPTGLVVPVVRGCEKLGFHEVEKAIATYGAKARNGQIAMEDFVGGTFTISNGGVYGSLMGTPIINPPQSAILGMHGIFKRPVAIGEKVEIRPMMYVALTYDHRLLDGSTAVQFLKHVKQCVEEPNRMLLGL